MKRLKIPNGKRNPMQPAIDFAQINGFEIGRTAGGHLVFTRGAAKVFASGATGDRRAVLNIISMLRRALASQDQGSRTAGSLQVSP